LFREVNERIAEHRDGFPLPQFDIVCECGDFDCDRRVPIEPEDYEKLRADPALFAVVPGHEIPEVESVVDRQGAYVVVRKDRHGPEELAELTDPRG
jgi:hypothetical protein